MELLEVDLVEHNLEFKGIDILIGLWYKEGVPKYSIVQKAFSVSWGGVRKSSLFFIGVDKSRKK